MCFSVVYTESHALAPLTYQNQTHKVIQSSSLKSDLCSQYGHLVDTLCASLPVDRPSEKEIELSDNESLRQEVIRARYKVWSDLFQLTNTKYILIIIYAMFYVYLVCWNYWKTSQRWKTIQTLPRWQQRWVHLHFNRLLHFLLIVMLRALTPALLAIAMATGFSYQDVWGY